MNDDAKSDGPHAQCGWFRCVECISMYSVLQCVLQHVAVCVVARCSVCCSMCCSAQRDMRYTFMLQCVLQLVAVCVAACCRMCCSMLQGVLQCTARHAIYIHVALCVAACCSVCCSMLQCVLQHVAACVAVCVAGCVALHSTTCNIHFCVFNILDWLLLYIGMNSLCNTM